MVTILTPTYNRCNEILRLYQSLDNQTNRNFKWLVVDDGSTDDTKEIVDKLKSSSDFPIKYVYKENGGKHTALNVGINEINSELTFIVDSDDWLTEDAVSSITNIHSIYKDNSEICGYSFLRTFPDGKINGKKFSDEYKIATYIDVRINEHDTNSDKAEVFFTRCLKEFPFPVFPNEKFLGEDVIWVRMARKYKMVHINKPIYVGNYLEDGLTKSRRKNNISSPLGCMCRAKEFISSDINIKFRLKCVIQYIVYGKFAGYTLSDLIKQTNYKVLVVIFMPIGLVIYYRWKKKYC